MTCDSRLRYGLGKGWEVIDAVHGRLCKKVQSKPKSTVKGSVNWQSWAVSVRDKLYKLRLGYI